MLNAGCFIAAKTVEMYMIMVVMTLITGGTNRIFGLKLLIRNAMKNTHIQKLLQAAINSSPVDNTGELFFQIGMRKGIRVLQESFKNFQPLAGLPELEFLKQGNRLIFH